MLIISIHGYLPRWTEQMKIGIWEGADYIASKFDGSTVLKLRYKDIIYKSETYEQIIFENKSGKFENVKLEQRESGKTRINKIILEIKKAQNQEKKVVVIGHSLGGWAAMHLIQEVQSPDNQIEPIDLFVEIDALAITKKSPIYTEDHWVSGIVDSIEHELKRQNGASSGESNTSGHIGRFVETLLENGIGFDADYLIHGAQQIISSVEDANIKEKYLDDDEGTYKGNQYKFDENQIKKHVNFYCTKMSLSNHVVQAATGLFTGIYPEEDNYPHLEMGIDLSHTDIDNLTNYKRNVSIFDAIVTLINNPLDVPSIIVDTSKLSIWSKISNWLKDKFSWL